MKRFVAILTTLFIILGASIASAATVAWDPYTDTAASELRIYSNVGDENWPETATVGGISTSVTASDIPDGAAGTRVFYMMRAYSADLDKESGNSNVVSVYWQDDGAGGVIPLVTGIGGVDGIRLLDCSDYQNVYTSGSVEWNACESRNTLP